MSSVNRLMVSRIKKEMRRMGVNARELSDIAKVGRSFVYDVLSGKSTNPTTKKIAAVADALGVSLPYLISGTSNDNEVREISDGDFSTIPSAIVNVAEDGSCKVTSQEYGNAYFFKKNWIENHLDVKPEDLLVVFIKGDGMSPALQDKDMVLIDTSVRNVTHPGVFMLFDGTGLVPKRLESLRKANALKILVKSDNAQYASYECDPDDVDVAGKVVWFSRKML